MNPSTVHSPGSRAAPSSTLCQSCASMRWKLQKVKYHPGGKGFEVKLQRPETSQLKLRDVVIGKNRCDFCALLYHFITGAGAMQDELLDKRIVLSSYRDDRARDDFEMELAIDGIRVAFQDHDQIELETKYPVLCQYLPLTKVPGPSGFQFSDDASHAPSQTDIVKRIKLKKSCDGADLAHFIPGEAPTPPEEQIVYAKARAWLDCCKRKHRSCRRGLSGRLYGSIKDVQDKSALPSRAVFVGAAEGDAPYLIETGGICAEYATLSYCWGEAPGAAGSGAAGWPHVTLTSNLEERLGGAPLDAMPRTIQHAILICQRLGLQYLWVDCLCIVQDDRADWNRESSKMREIYEQSTVTIVALGAKDIYQGCFFPRPPTHVSDSRGEHPGTGPVSLPFIVDDAYLGTVYAYPPRHGPDFHEVLDSVWNTRGWTFQERALSRRLLYFGRHQLLWECQKCRWTEDNTHNFNMNSPGRADNELEDEGGLKKSISAAVIAVNFVGGSQDLADDLQAMGHKVTASLYRAAILLIAWPVKKGRTYVEKFMPFADVWDVAVTEYSARALTEPNDKLLALQGLAEAFSLWRRRWSYSYGLYLANIACCLLWFSTGEPLRKPPFERAPSWSWIAWDGQVTMPAIFHVPIVSLKTGAGCLQEIEFDSPTLEEPSPFHTNGVLSLFGRLLEAKRSTQTIADDPSWVHTEGELGIWRSGSLGFQEPPRPPSHCFVLQDEQTSEPVGKVQFDDLSETPEVFTCLLVEDEKLTGQEDFDVGSVRSLACCVGEMVTRRYIRKYWLLALKPCGQLPRTYRRVGVAVAAYRKIDGTKCMGLPMHKLGRQTRIRLI